MLKKLLLLSLVVIFVALSANGFAAEMKMGYVNMRKVFFEYKKTQTFNKELEGKDAEVKKEIDKKTAEIRKLRDEIDLLSESAKAKKEPELRKKLEDLDAYRKDKIEGFIREKDEMFKEIREDILDVASRYAKKNGYDIIFDEAIFVYAGTQYDITSTVIKELNK